MSNRDQNLSPYDNYSVGGGTTGLLGKNVQTPSARNPESERKNTQYSVVSNFNLKGPNSNVTS